MMAAHESKPYPWRAGAWQKASESILNGTWKEPPPPRTPVILTPDGPISSSSQLQALAENRIAPPGHSDHSSRLRRARD